jgi:hypothetical protein
MVANKPSFLSSLGTANLQPIAVVFSSRLAEHDPELATYFQWLVFAVYMLIQTFKSSNIEKLTHRGLK